MIYTKRTRYPDTRDVWKGLMAGLVGGMAGAFVMSQFQALLGKLMEAGGSEEGNPEEETTAAQGQQESESTKEEHEPATIKTASAVSEAVFGHELTKQEKQYAGPAVHYAFGAQVGGLYGIVADRTPTVTTGAGIPFGFVVWLLADEAAVPALGLSKAPWKYPPSTHSYALASHLVYGLTTEAVRRLVRRVL